MTKARELRATGMSYKEIALELDMSVGSIHKALKSAHDASEIPTGQLTEE